MMMAEKQDVLIYVAVVALKETAGIGIIIDDETMTLKAGRKLPPGNRKQIIKQAAEDVMFNLKFFQEGGAIGSRFKLGISAEDYDTFKEFLPSWVLEEAVVCKSNPARHVAAEYAIGER